jgi:hypothetical protein
MISLIHPSRSRPDKSFANSKEWIEKAGCDVELIVSCDYSDEARDTYCKYYSFFPFAPIIPQECLKLVGQGRSLLFANNSSVVEATNRAAKEAKGDILVYLSDDFKCPDQWGIKIQETLKFYKESVWLLKVDDCLQQFQVPVLTIPIMSRGLYEKLGYFWHPGYKSMFVDEDLYWTCKKLDCMILAPELKFPHEHCSIGKAEHDETYKRSEKNWDSGKAFFAQRKAANFPLGQWV